VGLALHKGHIAEMRTGEGKTLVASLALYTNALEGKGAHEKSGAQSSDKKADRSVLLQSRHGGPSHIQGIPGSITRRRLPTPFSGAKPTQIRQRARAWLHAGGSVENLIFSRN